MEQPLDTDKMVEITKELMEEIAALLLSKPKTKEMHGAAVAALADLAVILACKLVGTSLAYEQIIPLAIAHGFKLSKEMLGDTK